MSAGRRRAEKVKSAARPKTLRYVALLCLGVLGAGTAWVFLVRAAIDFGLAARAGHGTAGWVLTFAATVGAAVCLLLVFMLLARVWSTIGLTNDYQPRRSSRSRRRG